MDTNEAVAHLADLCNGEDWFYSVGIDNIGRYVVYVKYMNIKNTSNLPMFIDDKQVLVHFASNLTATRDQFVETHNLSGNTMRENSSLQEELLDYDFNDESIRAMENTLSVLTKVCGHDVLENIFYEIKDGKNAVTNDSEKYPEVRQELQKLFDIYGFDVLFERI